MRDHKLINNYLNYLLNEKYDYNKRDVESHAGVGGIIWNDDHTKILVLKHVKFGFWTNPVGKAEENQSVVDALKMEMKEEVNIKVLKFKEVITTKKTYYRLGKAVLIDVHIFEVLKYTGNLRNNEPKKHSDMKWLTLQEIAKLPYISDQLKWILKYYKIK